MEGIGQTPTEIEKILEILNDRRWHSIREIKEKLNIHQLKLESLTDFLSEYSLVELDRKKKKIRLAPLLSSFLKEAEQV
jgi:DNA-binding IclR family transcriptional regulator